MSILFHFVSNQCPVKLEIRQLGGAGYLLIQFYGTFLVGGASQFKPSLRCKFKIGVKYV